LTCYLLTLGCAFICFSANGKYANEPSALPRLSFFDFLVFRFFICQGRATDPSTSLSWLDGDVVFRSDDARSAYAEPAGTWVLDSTNHTVPSLDVYTSSPGTSRVALSVEQLLEAEALSLHNLEKLPAALLLQPTT
jgi:hypothetical protein